MKADTPSATALRVAALRALHQTQDEPPIFVDPLAERILGRGGPALLATYRAEARTTARLRGTLAARAVVAEETIAEAAGHGVTQCVILGAGLDTFAYRHRLTGLHVFEVDHPATQGWKRGLLADTGIQAPDDVAFVAMQFERDDLFKALRGAGFDPARPAVFAMLGVVLYVDRMQALATFAAIAARSAPGSTLVFDYTEPFDTAPQDVRDNYRAVMTRVAADGEPWVTFFEPAPLHAALRQQGYVEVTDVDAAALQRRFCHHRTDGLTIAPLMHLVRART